MAGVRRAVRSLWRDGGLQERTVEELLGLAQRWFAVATTEDKLAAVLLLAEHLAPQLETSHVDALTAPLAASRLAEWNVRRLVCHQSAACVPHPTSGRPRSTIASDRELGFH